MLKSMKFPALLPAVLCVLSVMLCPLVLTSCPGNGEVDGATMMTRIPPREN